MDLSQKIVSANKDIFLRLKTERLEAVYSNQDDVLVISLGNSSYSYSCHTAREYLDIHYDPLSYRITGFTIYNFKNFLDERSDY